MALFGLACPLCIVLAIALGLLFMYYRLVFGEIYRDMVDLSRRVQRPLSGIYTGPHVKIPWEPSPAQLRKAEQEQMLDMKRNEMHLPIGKVETPSGKNKCTDQPMDKCKHITDCGWLPAGRTSLEGKCILLSGPGLAADPKLQPDPEEGVRIISSHPNPFVSQ